MSKTRTHHISFNGFQTTLNHPFVISHQKDLRWLLLSLETQLPFKKCSSESLNNSLLCSEEKLSYIGTLVKVWMKCNSLKLNQTWTISFLNINNIKMPLLKKKENSTKKKLDLLLSYNLHQTIFSNTYNSSIFLYKSHKLFRINNKLDKYCSHLRCRI